MHFQCSQICIRCIKILPFKIPSLKCVNRLLSMETLTGNFTTLISVLWIVCFTLYLIVKCFLWYNVLLSFFVTHAQFHFYHITSSLTVMEFSSLPQNNYLKLCPKLTSALMCKILCNEAVNASVTALCDSRWLMRWSRGKLIIFRISVIFYPLSRVWEGGYKTVQLVTVYG